jgi:hypothetical protein
MRDRGGCKDTKKFNQLWRISLKPSVNLGLTTVLRQRLEAEDHGGDCQGDPGPAERAQKYTHLAMVDIIDAYNIAQPRA